MFQGNFQGAAKNRLAGTPETLFETVSAEVEKSTLQDHSLEKAFDRTQAASTHDAEVAAAKEAK